LNRLVQILQGGNTAAGTASLEEAALALLLAFVLSQAAAWIYMYTHQGLSYSRAFVQSIIMLSIILALGMMIIGNNFAIAFGLVGALSVIRFRNILKDTRDTAFIFFALINSMACGTRNYGLAVLGAGAFCLLTLYLYWTGFGSRHQGDGFIRFRWQSTESPRVEWQRIMKRHCRQTWIVSQRIDDSGGGEISCRLLMRDPARSERLVDELRAVTGISNVTFVLQEDEAEV
jgi:hypothetical protein